MILKNLNLGTFFLRDHRRQHSGPLDEGLADFDMLAIGEQQHLVQLKLLINLDGQLLDEERIPYLCPVLPRA